MNPAEKQSSAHEQNVLHALFQSDALGQQHSAQTQSARVTNVKQPQREKQRRHKSEKIAAHTYAQQQQLEEAQQQQQQEQAQNNAFASIENACAQQVLSAAPNAAMGASPRCFREPQKRSLSRANSQKAIQQKIIHDLEEVQQKYMQELEHYHCSQESARQQMGDDDQQNANAEHNHQQFQHANSSNSYSNNNNNNNNNNQNLKSHALPQMPHTLLRQSATTSTDFTVSRSATQQQDECTQRAAKQPNEHQNLLHLGDGAVNASFTSAAEEYEIENTVPDESGVDVVPYLPSFKYAFYPLGYNLRRHYELNYLVKETKL